MKITKLFNKDLFFKEVHLIFDQEIPEPYRSIIDLPFDDHGWFFNSRHLKKIIENKQPKIVIEVGSWLGLSTRFIASHLAEDGVVYAIDTWLGSPDEPYHEKSPRFPHLYQLFLSNIKHAQLSHKIIPIRMESLEAAKALNVSADLIYIDASHTTPCVINDILHWYPHLNSGGIICGDDWSWLTVRKAVVHCLPLINQQIKEEKYGENFWWYGLKQVKYDENFWWYEDINSVIS